MEDKMTQPAQAMPVSSFMSSEIGELAAALAAAQGELEPATKNAQNPMLRNKYADLASCYEACRKVLPQKGLAVSQICMPCDKGMVRVKTVLMHTSGQWISSECTLEAVGNKGVNGAQAAGSAITYARRYGLSAIVGLVADEDDDGCNAGPSQKERVQQTRQQAKTNNPDPMTKAQHSAVMAYLTRRHGNDRQGYIDELSAFFGRTITSSAELTKSMASEFIDAINCTQQEA